MPTLPRNKLTRRNRSTPAPSKMDKFIENPTHAQTSMLLSQSNDFLKSTAAAQTVAFGSSTSGQLRQTSLNPVDDVSAGTEGNDGLPLIGVPAETCMISDNLQSHAPPEAEEGKMYVLEPQKFAFGFVEPPKYRLVKDLGKAKNGFLQSPAERQQRMLQTKLGQDARKQLSGDNSKEVRLVTLMKNRFPRGALGCEAPVSEGTVVYHDTIKEIDDKAWRNYSVAEARHGDLLDNLSHVQYTKYDPLKDGEAAGPFTAPDKFFQGKARIDGRDSFKQSTKTHAVKDVNPGRTKNIRNCQTKGRAFNIITGAGYEHLPPTIGETTEHKTLRQHHPSIMTRAGHL